MPSIRAGPATHGPTTEKTMGTVPDASLSALATRPQACSEARPSPTSAPDVLSSPTIGTPISRAVRTRRSTTSPSTGPMAPLCFPPASWNHATRRPSISVRHPMAAPPRRAATGTRVI